MKRSIPALLAIAPLCATGQAIAKRPLSIDDVLGMSHIDQVAIAPDRERLAVVVLRPAGPGEMHGRTQYEVDPSRGDIWLIDRKTGARRRITNGHAKAAGAWCAQWSPDGRRIAFLSTTPEGREPRGGNAVRLYLWDARSGAVRRLSDRAVMTQTRTGSGIWAVAFRGPADDAPRTCRTDEDKAPFTWTDNGHILVALRPQDATSGLQDEYARTLSLPGETLAHIRRGDAPTATKIGSGDERTTIAGPDARATVALVDVERRQAIREVETPAYPFSGELAVAVSPDARHVAILASTGIDAPEPGKAVRMGHEGAIDRRLGFFDLSAGGAIRWAGLAATRLDSWSPESRSIAVRLTGGELQQVSAATGTPLPGAPPAPTPPPAHAETLPDYAVEQARAGDMLIYSEPTEQGLLLRERTGGVTRTLLTLNPHLADIDWGRREIVDYAGPNGRPLKAAVLLPPGWRPETPLPTLVWVYPGTMISGNGDYFCDPAMPGFYNLRLYAARGFAVLIPSMPFDRTKTPAFALPTLLDGVNPAIDALIARGIADPGRLGILGQSLGGYAVNGIVTLTDRFKAAASIAGISDWRSFHLSMDPTGRGYAGVEHERSANMPIVEGGHGYIGKVPWEAPGLYDANSPIAFTDRIRTPLLLIHGEQDVRGGLDQAETLFMALWRQGKTSRLLRYWGESHGLALSPANVRDVHAELIDWFSRHLKK
ncbi:MAG: S9 family peptidase [Sphingobium sp.]